MTDGHETRDGEQGDTKEYSSSQNSYSGSTDEKRHVSDPDATKPPSMQQAANESVFRPTGLGAALKAAASQESDPALESGDPADASGASVPPKWGRSAAAAASRGAARHADGTGGGMPLGSGPPLPAGASPGGSWLWLPNGFERKKSWPRRHPVLFWGGILLVFLLVFGWGRMSVTESALAGPKVAVVNVEGMILDGADVIGFIEKVRKDDTYLGAIIRINSPGGAVGPSQEMYAAVKRLAGKKPVVASMGSLAASGGYYIALGADHIIAGPSTLTASIGVKMQIPNFAGLMHTLGVSETTLTTGRLKDAGSSTRAMSPDEEAYLRDLLDDMYQEFRDTVAAERELSPEAVQKVADGRAMTGRQAKEAGLVDELGDFHAAWLWVVQRSGLHDPAEIAKLRLVEGPEKSQKLLNKLLESVLETGAQQRMHLEQPIFLY